MGRRRSESSPTSSIDSSSHPTLSSTTTSSSSLPNRDLSTDLRLGLSLSSLPRDPYYTNWPPIKPLLRSTLEEKERSQTFFTKVYMEGIPIGRKVDLSVHDGYEGLIWTLRRMFRTSILFPDHAQASSNKSDHVLTYEDKEGDLMMVGDVPWE
ncbi:Auxin-responsive protein IAA4 [Acorus calamus]|nr:Auxin-responsive protein IAA4 [Acorus calamus]